MIECPAKKDILKVVQEFSTILIIYRQKIQTAKLIIRSSFLFKPCPGFLYNYKKMGLQSRHVGSYSNDKNQCFQKWWTNTEGAELKIDVKVLHQVDQSMVVQIGSHQELIPSSGVLTGDCQAHASIWVRTLFIFSKVNFTSPTLNAFQMKLLTAASHADTTKVRRVFWNELIQLAEQNSEIVSCFKKVHLIHAEPQIN